MIIKKEKVELAADYAFHLKVAAEHLENYLKDVRSDKRKLNSMTTDIENISDKIWKIEFEIQRINEALGFEFTSTKLAEECGVNRSRIRQLAPEMAKQGLAYKKGRDWRFKEDAVEYIKQQAGAGRPAKGKRSK